MADQLSFVVPGTPPSANKRLHWATLARLRAQFLADTKLLAWQAKERANWQTAAKVRLAFCFLFEAQRRRDPDNLIGSVKPLIDGLVAAGIIPDDSLDVVKALEVSARVDPTERRGVVVTVYAL